MTATLIIHGNAKARVWLFDFDNTLAALEGQVDWAASRRELESYLRSEGIGEAIFSEFPSRNLPLYDALLMRLLCRGGRDGQAVAVPSRVDGAALMRRASAIIEAYERRGAGRAAPLTGAAALLRALHARNNAVAIVTSNSSRTVARWLALHRLTAEVDAIVGRDSLLPLKPAPEMVVRALEACAGTAADAVFVGDSEADLHAAHRVQVGFFGIAATAGPRARLCALGAREIFSSPADLAIHLGLAGVPPNGPRQNQTD